MKTCLTRPVETLDGHSVPVGDPQGARFADFDACAGGQRHRGVLEQRAIQGVTCFAELDHPFLPAELEQRLGPRAAKRGARRHQAAQ